MAKYAAEEEAAQSSVNAMKERIEARKRELAERKAREVYVFFFKCFKNLYKVFV
jgi:hypothetical protein